MGGEAIRMKEERHSQEEDKKREKEEEEDGGKEAKKLNESPPPAAAAAVALSVSKRLEAAMMTFREGESARAWWCVWWVAVIAAVCTRLHYITMPYNVVWDEAHFGKMVSWYINRTFFMDVHPPGGKLLLALFGYLGGYNGSHSFASPTVSYEGYEGIMGMRVGCALVGAATVPLALHSVWTMTRSLPAAALAAALITCDIGSITLSKFILLDPPLFFFVLASFHGLCLMHSVEDRPFSWAWWWRYGYAGAMLGCVVSVKFVGLFVVCVVGLYTCLDLWGKLGDVHMPLMMVVKHFLARVVCLILLPITIYVTIFYIHDRLLYKAAHIHAAEESHFSPGFQMTLKENVLHNMTQPQEVAYGSLVTLRNDNLAGVYLHSHNLTYPGPGVLARMLQVTGFRAKDFNNIFRILFPEDNPERPDGFYAGAPELLNHGDWVRLYHPATGALVSCGTNKSYITKKHSIVYAKPVNLTLPKEEEIGQFDDVFQATPSTSSATATPWQMWRVVIEGGKPGQKIRTLDSRLKFLCVAKNCALTWSKAKLPLKWGGNQAEITCSNNLQNPYTGWIVEQNINPFLPNATYEHLRLGFPGRLLETHRVMTWVNSRLKPEGADLYHSHRPWMWPACLKSQAWYDVNFRIVLLGNPFIFWINLVFLVAAPALLIHHHFRRKRGHPDPPHLAERKSRVLFAVRWLLIAYLLHYLPFYTMDRILYYHHYFPALHFSSMLTAVVLGYLLERLDAWVSPERAGRAYTWALLIFASLLALSFRLYCYVGYGHPTEGAFNPDNSTFRNIRVFDEWEI